MLILVALIPVFIWLVASTLPADINDIRRSACLVDGRVELCVISGKDTLVLSATTVHQQGVWINKHWWWPSCDGRVLTVLTGQTISDNMLQSDSLRSLIKQKIDSLTQLSDRKNTERDELDYYLHSHGVQDEGYSQIATYATVQAKETDSIIRVLNALNAYPIQKKLTALRRGIYRVTWLDENGNRRTVGCKPILAKASSSTLPIILHTQLRQRPWGTYAVRHLPWPEPAHRSVIVCKVVPADTLAERRTLLIPCCYSANHRHNLPRLFATDGCAVFSRHGRFIGVIAGEKVLANTTDAQQQAKRKEDKQ